MDRGINARLRKNTGINFSIPTANTDGEESELKKLIFKFAEENTIEVPDKKKAAKGVRYRVISKQCLYNTFRYQNPDMCTYQKFCKYWPRNFTKPKLSDFGTCMCKMCQNMELNINALKKRGLLDTEHDFEEIQRANRDEDYELERRKLTP